MEGLGRKGMVRLVGVMLVVTMMVGSVNCDLTKVVWIPDHNYTEWSSQQHLYVGDWLLFLFDLRYFNVLEVNKTNYETCNDIGFIQNITRGGRDVMQLTEARPYYFLSSGGYCWHGMKLAIDVKETAPAPAPEPANNGSPGSSGMVVIPLLLSLTLAWLGLLS